MADIISTLGVKDEKERELLGRLFVNIEKQVLATSVLQQIQQYAKNTDTRGFVYKRLAVMCQERRNALFTEKQELLSALER